MIKGEMKVESFFPACGLSYVLVLCFIRISIQQNEGKG